MYSFSTAFCLLILINIHYALDAAQLITKNESQTVTLFSAKNAHDVHQALVHGCLLTTRNHAQETALHYAVKNHNLEVAQALMQQDPNNILINAYDNHGLTPLHRAAQRGNKEFIQYIHTNYNDTIDLDSALDYKSLGKKVTPLYIACHFSHFCVVEYLLNAGCKSYPETHTKTPQNTALLYACSHNDAEYTSAQKNNAKIAIVRLLLKKNPELITFSDKQRNNALHIACLNNNFMLIPILLEHGAHPHLINNDQETPLHIACRYQNMIAIALLLNTTSDIHKANYCNHTPADIAHQITDSTTKNMILELLYMYGATTYGAQYHNNLIATCIRHINTNAQALKLFLQMRTPEQLEMLYSQLPILIEYACAADKKIFSNTIRKQLLAPFPDYTNSYKPGYAHRAYCFVIQNTLHMMQQTKLLCDTVICHV